MHTYKKYWLIAIMIAMAAGSIAAQTPSVSITGDSPSIVVYDNTSTPTWITGTITVTKNISTVSNITVDLSPKADSPYPRNDWTYIGTSSNSTETVDNFEVFSSQSTSGYVIKMWGTDNNVRSSNVYTYRFSTGTSTIGNTKSFNYYAVFWHDSSLTAGTYEIPMTFRVRNEQFRSNNNPSTSPVSTVTITLKVVVSPSALITFLSGMSGSTTTTAIVFDDVAATTTKDFRVSVKSNFRYSLSVSSSTDHGGNLKHTDPEVTDMIPYTLDVGTITMPISSTPYPIALMERPTAESGTREYKAAVTVGNIQNYTAGTYSDSLSFTVTAQ